MNVLDPWNAAFVVGFIVYLGIRHHFEGRTRGHEKTISRFDAAEKVLLAIVGVGSLLMPVVYLGTPLLAFADYRLSVFARGCGIAVMLAALWLFWRSHADLGANWSVTLEIRKDHQLVRHGVYRGVRHPMYAAILLFGVAQALLLQNWVAGPSAVVTFLPLYFFRTPREEQMMREVFGDDYQEYMRHTGRIVPRYRRL